MIYFDRLFLAMSRRGFFKNMSNEEYLKRRFHAYMKRDLNLENPKSFNEKLQWLKLHDQNSIYTTMVDKSAAKEYVASIIGESYIIPTFGIWDRFENIDFDSLPNKFVLKCTHDSGVHVLVKDKSHLDFAAARKKFNYSLRNNYFYIGREWPYKNVKPRIIAEKYMEDNEQEGLSDYKIHSFNGEPKVILVCKDRFSKKGMTEDFFDIKWQHLPVKRVFYENSSEHIPKPLVLDEMISLSKKLSKNIPFLRTDFYIINEKVYFGELTFYPASGFEQFVPDSFDIKMGNWLRLPEETIL